MADIIRLTEREREILVISSLRAEASCGELAKLSGLREHRVRYILHSLTMREVMAPMHIIDHFRLGYLAFVLYFNRGTCNSKGRQSFENLLKSMPGIFWFAKMIGEFQYGLAFNCKKVFELERLYSIIRAKGDGATFDKIVGIDSEWSLIAPRYLAPYLKEQGAITLSSNVDVYSAEPIENQILSVLAQNPSATFANIARKLSLGTSTLHYKIDKLKKAKVLMPLVYRLNFSKLGILTYRLLVIERSFSESTKEQFCKFCLSHPNVTTFFRSTGGWDYGIRLNCFFPEELDKFCQALFDNFGTGIGTIKIIQQGNLIKRSTFPLQ